MKEIKLVKKYPNIRVEDVTEIFQEGYIKGFENGRKGAIPIEWINKYLDSCNEEEQRIITVMCYCWNLEEGQKENENN